MRTVSAAPTAATAIALVEALQSKLVATLESVSAGASRPVRLERVEWLRDGGRHGGGVRFEVADGGVFNRASVNVSHVHYDDEPARPLRSATALSSIIHPRHPRAPSLHMHISWTELRAGGGAWRIMADLNPAIPDVDDTARFRGAVVDEITAKGGADVAATAVAEGDRYFFIPALGRHRGVFHAYLERYATADADADLDLARAVGERVIDVYGVILAGALGREPSDEDAAAQLAYHTAYLFQVLTLDRGTTSGLLVHDENDIGILGSLPGRVDRALLASWAARVPAPIAALVDALVEALPDTHPSPVDTATRARLAGIVRTFFKAHPDALELQARGSVVPPTVANHGRP